MSFMELPRRLTLVTLFLIVFLCSVESKRQDGSIVTGDDWRFVSRFCFLSEKGRLRYKFRYPTDYNYLSILLYYDDLSQWDQVYPSNKNCTEKVAVLSRGVNQIIELNPFYGKQYWPYCEEVTKNGYTTVECELAGDGLKFRSMRERWWFIAVSHCTPHQGTKNGINLTYNLHLTNGDEDDILRYEFSADEFYILPILISFLIAYIVLCILTIVVAVLLAKMILLHSTFKIYMIVVFMWLFSLLLQCIAYGKYSQTGYEETKLKLAGRTFGALSEVIFLLMLTLMAKGYSITRGRLPWHSSMKVMIFFGIYTIAYAALFIVEAETFDPALVLYRYESVPGYGLIILRLLAWGWYCYSLFFTLKRYPKRGGFFYPFFILYTIWFWAGPIVILIAMFAMAPWTREKTVTGVENFVAMCGHIFFLVLTRPRKASDNFPYTTKTTQICILDGKENGAGGDRYQITTEASNARGPDLTNMFVTSREHSTKRNGSIDEAPPSYNQVMGNGQRLPSIGGTFSTSTDNYGNRLPPVSPSAPPVETSFGGRLPPSNRAEAAPTDNTAIYDTFTVQ